MICFSYNVTVQGFSQDTRLWFISEVFSTTDYGKDFALVGFDVHLNANASGVGSDVLME